MPQLGPDATKWINTFKKIILEKGKAQLDTLVISPEHPLGPLMPLREPLVVTQHLFHHLLPLPSPHSVAFPLS